MTTQPENKAEAKFTTDELTGQELDQVTGGDAPSQPVSEFHIVKVVDKSSPILFL